MPRSYWQRQASHVAKHVKQRYTTKTGGFRINQVVKDVAYLKDMINAEKKRVTGGVTNQLVGQTNINANGLYASDITPVAPVGTGIGNRTGASIKLHSSYFRFGISQNTAQSTAVKGRIVLVMSKGVPVNPTTVSTQYWSANPFVTGGSLVDYNSQFNPDYFGTYKILRTKKFSISADQIASQNTILNFGMGMKYFKGKGHHIRYDANTSTVLDGQLMMFVFVDNGNVNAASPSTLTGVATPAINTGVQFSYNLTHYYYDN